jgi:anti-sigma factor RsiW
VNRLDCAQLIDLAPELAAGNLCGEERAAAIAHLATCTSCQQEVTALTTVTDRLLLLAPPAEPPNGFEQRVLAAIPTELDRRRRPRRRAWAMLAAAAAALVLAFSAGALLLGPDSSDRPAFAAAEMRTSAGDVVGQVVFHSDDPASLYLTLPGWAEQVERYGAPGAAYAVRIETTDGNVTTRPITPTDGASWATTLDVAAGAVRSVAVVDGNGYVWCQADLGST